MTTCSYRFCYLFPAGARTFNLNGILVILILQLYFLSSTINLLTILTSNTLCSVFLYWMTPRLKSAHPIWFNKLTLRANGIYAELLSSVVALLVAKFFKIDEGKLYYATWLHYSIIEPKITADSWHLPARLPHFNTQFWMVTTWVLLFNWQSFVSCLSHFHHNLLCGLTTNPGNPVGMSRFLCRFLLGILILIWVNFNEILLNFLLIVSTQSLRNIQWTVFVNMRNKFNW